MYVEEYKAWITCKAIHPKIVKTLKIFNDFLFDKISLVNQTPIPANLHGYGMAAVNEDKSVTLYRELITNFGATYTSTQDMVKTQVTTIASMQGQLNAMMQYCMVMQIPTPLTIYMPVQLQRKTNNNCRLSHHNGYSGGGNQQQPVYLQQRPPNSVHPPTPYKWLENWHYCHTHVGDVNNNHTSMS
jgi:hypothetical protein